MSITYISKLKTIIGVIVVAILAIFFYQAIILPKAIDNNNVTGSDIDNTPVNNTQAQVETQKEPEADKNPILSKTLTDADSSSYKQTDNAINIRNFGAKGEGISSVKEDTKALEDAIDYLKKRNGGKLYLPATDKFYAYAGKGLLLSDNIEIYGDGEKSVIRTVNPDISSSYTGVIFFTSTYGPVNKISVVSQPKYNIKDVKKGSSTVEIVDEGAKKLSTGKVIALAASPFSKDGDPNKTRYLYFELNEVASVNGSTIKLKYPTSIDLMTDNASKPVLINVNSEGSTSFLGEKNSTTKNIQIHDLRLSQAQTNEVDNAPLKKAPVCVIQLGGTFESKFYNLWIDCYSGISGNMWSRCEFNNIVINANKNLIDWGYGSSNSKFTNIKYTYTKSAIADIDRAFIYFSEASHDIQMENIQAVGNWNGTHLLLVGNGAKGLTMKNVDINFPNLVNTNFGITIADQDNKVYSSDITLQNVKIRVNKVKKLIRFAGKNDLVDRNIQLNNVELSDATNTINSDDIAISNMKGVHFNDVYSQKSKLDISDVTSQKIKQKLRN